MMLHTFNIRLAVYSVICLVFVFLANAAVYITILPDVQVFATQNSVLGQQMTTLPLGEIIVGVATNGWIKLRLPCRGFVSFAENGASTPVKLVSEATGTNQQVCQRVKSKLRGDRAFLSGNHSLASCTSSGKASWVDQWPLGGGALGALVGGTLGVEIVPISHADYYVTKRDLINSRFVHENKDPTEVQTHMKSMREHQMAGKVLDAHSSSDKIRARGGQGRFEFIGDLAFVFGESEKEAPCISDKTATAGPRAPVLEKLKVELKSIKEQCFGTSVSTNQVHHLNMMDGVASASYVSTDNLSVHHRRWLVTPTGVLFGEFQCSESEEERLKGCLSFAMQISRTTHKREGINLESIVESGGKSGGKHKLKHKREGHQDVHHVMYKFSLKLYPSQSILAPHAVMCVAVACIAPEGYIHEESSHEGKAFRHHATADTVVCHGSRKANVFSAVQTEDSLEALRFARDQWRSKNFHADEQKLEMLKSQCWEKIEAAISDLVPNAHHQESRLALETRAYFASHLQAQSLSIGGGISSADSALTALGSVQAMWEFGRYLLLAAAKDNALNLQGVWGDGRMSEWSGDYHLNINMQMAYWPAEVTGLGSAVISPLIVFLRRLRESGAETARRLYGCKGWVAHGYVDGYLDTGVMGDVRWAYCISCGAWMSLALWEHLSFMPASSPTFASALTELLLSFKGTADFFLDHAASVKTSNGTIEYHIGPGGSPETSYSGTPGVGSKKAAFSHAELAMSTALDISVLRNVALAYSAALWAVQQRNTHIEDLPKHVTLSEKLLQVVRGLPNSGSPAVLPNGHVAEFPAPFGTPSDQPPLFTISESEDLGHRHWSGMHWLFPGAFAPPLPEGALRNAAEATLSAKGAAGSGHTSWSASWQAVLWARLGRGDSAWTALQHLLDSYTTPRLMSLHPKLQKSKGGCETCFAEKRNIGADAHGRYAPGRARPHAVKRTMATEDESIFQLDGNLGFVATVHELLLQTHIPGKITLLPALPSSWLTGGRGIVRGLRGRGDLTVDMIWDVASDGKGPLLSGARLVFGSEHFHNRLSAQNAIQILGPSNKNLRVISHQDCSRLGADGLVLTSYPCTVYACDKNFVKDCIKEF